MCVRFGPTCPTIIGFPLIVWQPRQAPVPFDSSAAPRAASPCASSDSSNVSPAGVGVWGMLAWFIFSAGNATKPACVTVAGAAAPTGTPVLGAPDDGVVTPLFPAPPPFRLADVFGFAFGAATGWLSAGFCATAAW